jgi:hypothetical protein
LTSGYTRANPLSTTYQNPKLSVEEDFTVEVLEVWCLDEVKKYSVERKKGILSLEEELNFLEISGKKVYSRDIPPEV